MGTGRLLGRRRPKHRQRDLLPHTRRRGVTARVAEQILSVLPTMDTAAPAALIDAAGTRRRLGALMLQGHTLTSILTALEVSALGRVLTRDRVTARVARQVRDYYDLHWNHRPAPSSPRQAAAIKRSMANVGALRRDTPDRQARRFQYCQIQKRPLCEPFRSNQISNQSSCRIFHSSQE